MLLGKHLDILLAEPDMAAVEQLAVYLDEWEYPYNFVRGGYDTYAQLSTLTRPTIALLSMNLPEMSAPEILHKMRGTVARRRFSAILLAEDTRSDTVRMALDAGADDLLVKPCDAFELRVRISVAERILSLSCELADSQSAASYYATHDALTGIWNRETFLSMFFRETDRVQRTQDPLALMLMDIDGLDQAKAEHGVMAGDRLLQQVVERLQRFLRSYDILGRYGDNEFMIALPGLRLADTERLIARMKQSIFSRPFRLNQAQLQLGAHFGVAQSKGHSPLVVLREAERELALARMERHTQTPLTSDRLRRPEEDQELIRIAPHTDRVQ